MKKFYQFIIVTAVITVSFCSGWVCNDSYYADDDIISAQEELIKAQKVMMDAITNRIQDQYGDDIPEWDGQMMDNLEKAQNKVLEVTKQNMATFALYFHSRKNFSDKSTWGKELLPVDYTENEVATAAKVAGCEGYAIMDNSKPAGQEILSFKWFVG